MRIAGECARLGEAGSLGCDAGDCEALDGSDVAAGEGHDDEAGPGAGSERDGGGPRRVGAAGWQATPIAHGIGSHGELEHADMNVLVDAGDAASDGGGGGD